MAVAVRVQTGAFSSLAPGPGGIALVGAFPTALPSLALPSVSLERLPLLLSTALSVTLVGFIESVSVANMYALKHGYTVSAESELKALGLANVFGASMGALPVMAAFGRSSVNDDCGAFSPMAQAVSALTVAVIVLTISPALFFLPKAALGAVICVAVSSLLRIGKQARALWRADRSDLACLAASFAATVLLGVLYGVSIAILISITFFVGASTRSTVVELGRLRGSASYAPLGEPGVAPQRVARVLRFDAPLWFANCATLKDRLLRELAARRHQPPLLRVRALVLDMSAVSSVDSTAAEMLTECIAAAAEDSAPIFFASVPHACERELERFGLVAAVGGRECLFPSVHDAVRTVAARELRRGAGLGAVGVPRAAESTGHAGAV
jgi:SulP family sulfate permease